MTTIENLIKRLQEQYNPNDVVAVAIWGVEDVMTVAEDMEINISKEKAEEILDKIDHKQSAELGISWDTIECYLGE